MEQVQTILNYVGKGGISKVIKGANDEKDALKKFRQSKDSFLSPVVCSLPLLSKTEVNGRQCKINAIAS